MNKKGKSRAASDEPTVDLVERIGKLLETLEAETDRGCPLVASEYLSDILEELLRARFLTENLDEREISRLLKGFNAPIGSFAVRISLCRAIGLITPQMFDVLTALREIRNHCAHSDSRVSLNDKEIGHWVRAIKANIKVKMDAGVEDNKQLIIGACIFVARRVHSMTAEVYRRHVAVLEAFIAVTQSMPPTPQSGKQPASHQKTDPPKSE